MDSLKSVFFWASLAQFEESGPAVRGKRKLLEHDVFGNAHFLPEIHRKILGKEKGQNTWDYCHICDLWQHWFVFLRGALSPIKPWWLQIMFSPKKKKKKAYSKDCWSGNSAIMMNEEISSPSNQLMPAACFVVCSSCELQHADHRDVTGPHPNMRCIICHDIFQLPVVFRPSLYPGATQLSQPGNSIFKGQLQRD